MFRRLTRGRNEKVQIRNIKSAEYPQKGCKEMWIPSVVKTNCTQSGHIVAVRSTSMDNPSRIDNQSWHFNQSFYRLSVHVPYLNLAKGRNGQSVSPFRIQGPQAGNLAENLIFKSNKHYFLQVLRIEVFCVWSFSSPLAYSDLTTIGVPVDTRIINQSNGRNRIAKNLLFGYPEISHSAAKFADMIFHNSRGGVKTGVTIQRPNSVLSQAQFKHYRTLDSVTSLVFTPVTASLRVVHNLMDIHGAINYAFSSTNENTNASWLLNQKTQYGRKTVPIRMIY